jgi:hypothetical protein
MDLGDRNSNFSEKRLNEYLGEMIKYRRLPTAIVSIESQNIRLNPCHNFMAAPLVDICRSSAAFIIIELPNNPGNTPKIKPKLTINKGGIHMPYCGR